MQLGIKNPNADEHSEMRKEISKRQIAGVTSQWSSRDAFVGHTLRLYIGFIFENINEWWFPLRLLPKCLIIAIEQTWKMILAMHPWINWEAHDNWLLNSSGAITFSFHHLWRTEWAVGNLGNTMNGCNACYFRWCWSPTIIHNSCDSKPLTRISPMQPKDKHPRSNVLAESFS